jgi:flagellar hook-associated protein 3 FlgL
MNLRVTGQTQINNALANLRRQAADGATYQNQISSGLKVKAASDDPAAFTVIAQARAVSKRSSTYQDTLTDTTTDLNAGVSVLTDTNTLLSRARQIAQDGASSSTDAAGYEALATEVDTLIEQSIHLANQQSDGRYLFGGTADTAPPFRVATTGSDGKPATIAYDGAAETATARIGPALTVSNRSSPACPT